MNGAIARAIKEALSVCAPREGSAVSPGESGQAMAEYAIIVSAIVTAVVATGFNFLPRFIEALQLYYDNYFLFISLPVP